MSYTFNKSISFILSILALHSPLYATEEAPQTILVSPGSIKVGGISIVTDAEGRLHITIPRTPKEFTDAYGIIIPLSRIIHDIGFNTECIPPLNETKKMYAHILRNASCPPRIPFESPALSTQTYTDIKKQIETEASELSLDFERYHDGLKVLFTKFFLIQKSESLSEETTTLKPLGIEALTLNDVTLIHQKIAGLNDEDPAIREDAPEKLNRIIQTIIHHGDLKVMHPICLAAYALTNIVRLSPFISKNNELALLIANFILMKGGYIPVICDKNRFESVITDLKALDQGPAHDRAVLYLAQEAALIAHYHNSGNSLTNEMVDDIRAKMYRITNATLGSTPFNPLIKAPKPLTI